MSANALMPSAIQLVQVISPAVAGVLVGVAIIADPQFIRHFARTIRRVSSGLMSVMALSQVLAMSGAGPIAQSIGIQNLYYLSAALLLGIAAFGYPRIPKARPS
jgi:hypothetical protein